MFDRKLLRPLASIMTAVKEQRHSKPFRMALFSPKYLNMQMPGKWVEFSLEKENAKR